VTQIHGLLAPTRSAIWNVYRGQPDRRRIGKGRLLSSVLDAIVEEIDARFKDPALRRLDPEQTNRRLIEGLTRRLTR
jgi:hypothetical protein